MKTKIENGNTLVVVTDIKKATYDKLINPLTAKDEDNNELFVIKVSKTGKASISEFGLTCNTTIEDKLGITMVLPSDGEVKTDDVKKLFGPALVKAKHFSEVLAAQAEKEVADIDAVFAE